MCRSILLLALTTIASVGLMLAQQSSHKSQIPKFTELTSQNAARLDQQRAVIANAAKQRFGVSRLTRTKADLPVLQKLIDNHVFKESQTYELQCLGVAFGDVLANELPLRWEMITDEYGTDPTLRFKETHWNVNALTMISKRVERGEVVNVNQLLTSTRKYLSKVEKDEVR